MGNNIPFYKSIIDGVNVVKTKSPIAAQIEFTSSCQYNCIFCYNYWKDQNKFNKNEMSHSEIIQACEKLIEAEIFSIIVSGGEPTLSPSLTDVIKLFSEVNIDTIVITNGAKLSQMYIEKLLEAGLDSMQISMHHYQEGKMNSITGNSLSYQKTLDGIKNSVRYFGADYFNVNMVVTKDTVEDITQMGEFLQKLGVKNFSIGLVSYCGEARMNDLLCGQKDFDKAYVQLQKLSHIMDVGITGGIPFCIIPDDNPNEPVFISNACDAGISQIVVSPNGDLRPCVELPTVVGNILKDDLFDIWQNSPELLRIREFRNTPISCRSCDLISLCHGGCRASALSYTGEETGVDPLMEAK